MSDRITIDMPSGDEDAFGVILVTCLWYLYREAVMGGRMEFAESLEDAISGCAALAGRGERAECAELAAQCTAVRMFRELEGAQRRAVMRALARRTDWSVLE